MRVKEVMMGTPYTCRRETNLGEATELMWKGNCGFLPVLGQNEKVCGVVTDRDICIALGTRNKPAGEITVGEVTTNRLYACLPDEEIHVALLTMRDGHVRRLPAIDSSGKEVGVLSMDDILLHAEPVGLGKVVELSTDEVVRCYRAINTKDLPQVMRKQAAAALKWPEQDLSLVSGQDRARTAANECSGIPSWIVSPQAVREGICVHGSFTPQGC